MNYYPETTLFLLTNNKKESFNDIEKFLEQELAYLKDIKFKVNANRMYVYLYEDISAISFFDTNERLNEVYKHLNIKENNIQFLEVSSGPNHDYSHMPIYYATEIALLNYEGAYIAGREEKLVKTKDYLKTLNSYIKDLEGIVNDDDGFNLETSAKRVINYIKREIDKHS